MAKNGLLLGLLVAIAALATRDADAAGRRGWRTRAPQHAATTAVEHRVVSKPRGSTSPADRYYRALHPKYQTNFHARDMQNLGIPTGDIGLRGNGMGYMPW